jgi:hypothetical protein
MLRGAPATKSRGAGNEEPARGRFKKRRHMNYVRGARTFTRIAQINADYELFAVSGQLSVDWANWTRASRSCPTN